MNKIKKYRNLILRIIDIVIIIMAYSIAILMLSPLFTINKEFLTQEAITIVSAIIIYETKILQDMKMETIT